MIFFKFNKLCHKLHIKNTFRLFTTKYLTEHEKFNLKVSLCIERQPLEYDENHLDNIFREFREIWSLKTKNSLKIPSLSTIERKITHKLSRSKDKPSKILSDDSSDTKDESTEELDLESLLSTELDIRMVPRRSRTLSQKESDKIVSKLVSDDDPHNVNRLPKKWLLFLVKYKDSSWSLPVTDLYFGDSVRETLKRLCEEHISTSYRPYFVGYSPFLHQKLYFDYENNGSDSMNLSKSDRIIEGEKVFYYRARHIPSSDFVHIKNELIDDYSWFTFDELQSKLDKFKFHKVLNSLPIYNMI